MKELIKENIYAIFIVIFYAIEIPTMILAVWEAYTGKSIVDKIADAISKKKKRKDDEE